MTYVSMLNSYYMGHTIMEHSPTVILLNKKTRISHRVHVYYMIKLFDVFRSVYCVLYIILDTRNLDLSLRDLLEATRDITDRRKHSHSVN